MFVSKRKHLWKKRDRIAIHRVKTIIRMMISSILMLGMLGGSWSFPCPLEQLRKLTMISMIGEKVILVVKITGAVYLNNSENY